MIIPRNIQQISQKLMLALKTLPDLSITINGSQINYIQKETTAPIANHSQNYHLYKRKTRSHSENRLPRLLKQALEENLLIAPIDIPPNATMQQKLLLLLNKQNNEHTSIYKYFYIGKTLYERKLELKATNLTPEAIQKQIHNEFKTAAGPTNTHYKLRAAFRLYDLFNTYQITSIILDHYLNITNSAWTLTELSFEEEIMLPQYAVVNFKNTSSAATVFFYWSVLVRKNSVRILFIANQKEVIFLRDIFKAKLLMAVHVSFSAPLISINVNALLCLDHLAVDCKVLLLLSPKLFFNSVSSSNIFKSFFVGAKSYAKAVTFVVPSVAAAANTDLAFGAPSKGVVPLLPVVSSGSDVAVNANELSLLIKSIVEPVGFLVVLVTKLLSTPPVMAEAMKKSVIGLENQINAVHAVAFVLQKEVWAIKLRSGKIHFDISDDEDIDDEKKDNDNDVKDFSVYDDTFNVMMEL
ncbi:hypothetical protein G9A89_006399 [Geosiphon pyriformis]|nr:hypothetical protein G9A89_006399 [Geosiphon pyriformis]